MMADSGVSEVAKRPEGSNGDGPEVSSSNSSQQHKRPHGDDASGLVGSSTDEHPHDADSLPTPLKKSRLTFGLAKPDTSGAAAPSGAKASPTISIKFGAQKPKEPQTTLKKMNVFNADDEDDEEEMPPEAKMRMRNLGRETPTSTGPNSFGKTKSGFCDTRKIFGKNEPGATKSSKELKKS